MTSVPLAHAQPAAKAEAPAKGAAAKPALLDLQDRIIAQQAGDREAGRQDAVAGVGTAAGSWRRGRHWSEPGDRLE